MALLCLSPRVAVTRGQWLWVKQAAGCDSLSRTVSAPRPWHSLSHALSRALLHRNVRPHHPGLTKKLFFLLTVISHQATVFLSLVAVHSHCRPDPRNHGRYQVSHPILPIAKCQPLKTCKDLSIIALIVLLHVQSSLPSLSLQPY